MVAPIPFSVEVYPARSSAAALALGHSVHRLAQHGPSFVAVTSGADGSSASDSADLVDYVSVSVEVPVLAHVTTWGKSRDELDARVRELRDQGVRQVLAVRGDPPRVDPSAGSGDVTASDLVAIAHDVLAADGTPFEIAVAAFPQGHPSGGGLERDLELLLSKQQAGATRALTQVQFTADDYAGYVARARAYGITIPIVPGVLPVASAQRLRRVAELAGTSAPAALEAELEAAATKDDALDIGVAHAVAVSRALLEAGAPSIHFYTLNLAEPVLRVLADLGSSTSTPSTSASSITRDVAVASTERELV
ncbi:MAG: 5,10-methylenetetrahydrofolate reductase [Frondihabitans sp.]|nr:5,10-methylenetetrahydrofolate reductase [Frondihabitans sp.]